MKTFSIIMFIFLINSSSSFAETSGHKHTSHALSPEMKKQHEAMSAINKHWKACKAALKDNNFRDADLAVETIIEAAANIDRFKLHKNTDKQEQFTKQCNDFRENIQKLKDKIKTKDAGTLDSLSTKIDESCKQCHASFR